MRTKRGSSPVLPSQPVLPQYPQQPEKRARPSLLPRLSSSSRKRLYSEQVTLQQRNEYANEEADLAAAFSTSSDPAFFSSDETPDLENYSNGPKRRKKKVYSGTWWSGRLRPSTHHNTAGSNVAVAVESPQTGLADDLQGRAKKHRRSAGRGREFKRNFDSGIFMADETDSNGSGGNSSGVDLSSDGLLEELRANQRQEPLKLEQDEMCEEDSICTATNTTTTGLHISSKPMKKLKLETIVSGLLSETDMKVNAIIQQCLETNNPDIDLTNLEIKNVPSTITQLKTLVKTTDPLDDYFAPFSCRLRMYLANNQLSLFPGALLQLPSIEFLSLRQNQLSELPDTISELRRLKEINISGNRLEYLPYSLLYLCDSRLETIQSDPNPWRDVPPADSQLDNFPYLVINRPRRSLCRVAVETATRHGPDGNLHRQTQRDSTTSQTQGCNNRAPFLGELVLRQLSKLHTTGIDLSTLVETELCSDLVKSMLHNLYRAQQSGGKRCTFCDRQVIMPRYQWLEWWRIDEVPFAVPTSPPRHHTKRYDVASEVPVASSGRVLPFMRVACGCRSQVEGLTEEKELWLQYASLFEEEAKSVSGGEIFLQFWEWPTLEHWKRRVEAKGSKDQ